VPAETKKAENDIDILNVVRQINIDNLGLSTNFESSNGHENSSSKKLQKDTERTTIKKRKGEDLTLVPVPKRKRSSFVHGKSRSSSTTSKAPPRVSGEDSSRVKLLSGAEFNPDTDSKTIQRKKVKGNEPSIEAKVKISKSYHEDSVKSKEHDMKVKSYCQADLYHCRILKLNLSSCRLLLICFLLQSPDNSKPTDKSKSEKFKSSTGSAKKLKRKSIGGLAKVNFSTSIVVNVVVVFK